MISRWFLATLRVLSRIVGWCLIVPVILYKLLLSPFLGQQCRFQPTCSTYFIQAVHKYGPIVGAWRGVCRIGRCHPWNPGGYDPP